MKKLDIQEEAFFLRSHSFSIPKDITTSLLKNETTVTLAKDMTFTHPLKTLSFSGKEDVNKGFLHLIKNNSTKDSSLEKKTSLQESFIPLSSSPTIKDILQRKTTLEK